VQSRNGIPPDAEEEKNRHQVGKIHFRDTIRMSAARSHRKTTEEKKLYVPVQIALQHLNKAAMWKGRPDKVKRCQVAQTTATKM
jgi:hypothetical protein